METIKGKYLISENFNTKVLINEDWIENLLLVAGFAPIVGEIADIILIIKFLREKRYIEAGLMLFALIPTVGDAIVKPFLKLGKPLGAFSNPGKFGAFLMKNPAAKKAYIKMGKFFNDPKITKLIDQVKKVMPSAGKNMEAAKTSHINMWGKVVQKQNSKMPGSMIQQGFRRAALKKYLIKTGGVAPKNFLSSWWNVVYKGSMARKSYINKIILTSNLLHGLGIFSIRDLENRMSDEKEAEKLLQDPKFKEFYDQVNKEENDQENVSNDAKPTNQPSNLGGLSSIIGANAAPMGLSALKTLARVFT